MAGRDWSIEGKYVEYCSCDLGCPCESMADPTYGTLHRPGGFQDRQRPLREAKSRRSLGGGYFLLSQSHSSRPGCLTARLSTSVLTMRSGTRCSISCPVRTKRPARCSRSFRPLSRPSRTRSSSDITFEWDQAKRTARIEVPGIVRATSEPIRNPVTNEEHRMLTVLPDGWVFHEAESAAGFAKGIGAIKFDLNRRHSSLANVAWDPNGLVHSYDEYKQKFGRP